MLERIHRINHVFNAADVKNRTRVDEKTLARHNSHKQKLDTISAHKMASVNWVHV